MANGIIQFNNQSKSEFEPCFRIHHDDLAGTICWMLILIVDTGSDNVIVWNPFKLEVVISDTLQVVY